jgi:hypothetical protein
MSAYSGTLKGRRTSTALFWRESSSKATLRLTLEMAYPLAGNAEFVAERGQGRRLSVVQPVPAHQDVPFTGRHLSHRLPESGVLHLPDHRLGYLRGPLVLYELP